MMGETRFTTDTAAIVPARPIVIEMIDDDMVEVMRSKTIAQKLAILNDMHRTARHLVRCGVKMQHADWTPDQVELEVSQRLLHGSN